jgi:1-acyl-sn-glycerol-3-phosphate acyltransferase
MKKEKANAVYWMITWAVRFWARIWFRIEYHGQENIPREGGCVVACNHVSYLDPPLVGVGVTPYRVIRFVARSSLRKNRLLDWLYDRLLSIPLDRSKGDLKAMRVVLNVLKEGTVVGLFPEGTRSKDGTPQQAKGGIGFLISKAGVPVVPACIQGSHEAYPPRAKFIRPRKIKIYYGTPITPEELMALGSGKERYQRVGDCIMEKIAELAATS